MKIVFVLSSLSSGGAERVATTLCNSWVLNRNEVTIIATYSGGGEVFYEISPDVSVIFLANMINAKKKNVLTKLTRLRTLRNLIKHEKPDVIISFMTEVNIATLLASIGMSKKVIVCERNNPYSESTSLFFRFLRYITYPLSGLVTVQTKALLERFRKDFPWIKSEVVSNPIPIGLLEGNHRKKKYDGRKRYRLVAMGRLEVQKGFDLLIDAFSQIASECADWDLWIWGEGKQREALEQRINKENLNNRVYLPGRTIHPWEELYDSDIFILSSRFEGMPNVMLEAMALGLPVIAFDCPQGPAELSNNGKDAILVPSGDIFTLSKEMRALMYDQKRREELGKRAKASVVGRYSLDIVLEQWEKLFNKIG